MSYLNKFFKNKKIIPIDNFFDNALYDKKNGYYSKKNPIGKKGDFITSPMISSLFSEMVAIWIVSYWELLNKPKSFNFIELGPGTGKLCKDLIKVFRKFPKFYSSTNIFLYEKSYALKKIQKDNIKENKLIWIKNLKRIKKGPVIFFGNEFFDAIPIKQFKRINGKIYERFVKIEKNEKIKSFLKEAKKKDEKELKKYKLFDYNNFVEFPKIGLSELDSITKKIKELNGGLLLIDYGYLHQKNLNSLQSVKNHKKNDIFSNIGNADITSLVNFKLLRDYFQKNKLNVNNVVTQRFFLSRIGILTRAEIISKKMNFKEKSDLFLRLKRLLEPKYMGEIFKVFFAYKGKRKVFLGFN